MFWVGLAAVIELAGVILMLDRIGDALELKNRRDRRQSRGEPE